MNSSDFTHMQTLGLVVLFIDSVPDQELIPQIGHQPVVDFATFQSKLLRQHVGIVPLVAYRYAFLILEFSEEPCVDSMAGLFRYLGGPDSKRNAVVLVVLKAKTIPDEQESIRSAAVTVVYLLVGVDFP